jgi:pimeloyl-ACP methyl ester carboxylesterase
VGELWVGVPGARLFVPDWGKSGGQPLLCWHGVGLTSRASLFLNEAGPLLASRHGLRVLALDAPGFGRSPPSERRDYHPHVLVDLVPPLLDSLGLARVAFMGFSWGGDLGCHLAARHADRLAALVLLDAGYSDPRLDPALSYEERVERNELAWREACAPSWDAVVTALRAKHRRWTAAVEEACRAGWREQGGQLVPAVSPWVVAAVEHGMAQALPSATRPSLPESRIPVLVVASGDAPEEDLAQFAADVPQAEILRAEGTGHDVLADAGPKAVHTVGEWLEKNASWEPAGEGSGR